MDKRLENIEKYIDGELSAEEMKELENAIDKNIDLRKQFYLSRDINKSISEDDVQDLRLKMKNIFSSEERIKSRNIIIKNSISVISIASIVVFVIFFRSIFSLSSNMSNNELYSNYFTMYNIMSYSRTNVNLADSLDKNLNTAFVFYTNNDFDSSLKYFNKALSVDNDNILVCFYSAIVNIKLENFSTAESNLKYIIDSDDNLFLEQSKWYLSLLYLAQNKETEAIVLLQDLQLDSKKYKDNANEILKIIEK